MQPSKGRQRHRAGAHARVHSFDGAVSPHDAERVRRSRRAPGRTDGQLGGRAHEHGCRAGGVPGPDANRPVHRRRRALREPGARARRWGDAPAAGARCISLVSCRTEASTATSDTSMRWWRWRGGTGRRVCTCTPSPMAATRHRRAESATWQRSNERSRRRALGRLPASAGATTQWIATAAGSHASAAYDAMVHGTGKAITSPRDWLQESYAAGTTDEFIEPAV